MSPTKAELIALAEENDVEVSESMTKAEIEAELVSAGIDPDAEYVEPDAEESDEAETEVRPEAGGAELEAASNAANIEADKANVEAFKVQEAEALAATDEAALDAQIAQHEEELDRLRAAKEGA